MRIAFNFYKHAVAAALLNFWKMSCLAHLKEKTWKKLCLRHRQIIDLLAPDKLRLFSQPRLRIDN